MTFAQQAFQEAPEFSPEEPSPLVREIPSGERYPLEALGPLRDAATALHDITQAPAAICAQSVLGVAALAAQALGDAETLHGRAPVSLFLMTVAQSGERKSACDALAMRAVRDFEAELAEARRDEMTAHRNRLEIWQTRRAEIVKQSKQDPVGAEADLAAIGREPEPPLYASITSADPTVEGLIRNMDGLRPALGLFSDEGGAFIGGHGMNPENRLKTVASLSGLWGGQPVSRWRGGDGVSVFHGRRVSAHLMAQPVAAAGLLADPIANGQGFLARFLLTEPPSAIGTRLRVGHSASSDAALERFNQRISELLRQPLPMREGSRNELDPPVLSLAPDARALLQTFALEVEQAQARGGALEPVRPFASKAAEHAARLAAVLTIYNDPDARVVTAETMADAVTLATFYLGEAARLSDAATISQETAEADRLLKWLLESWREPFISASDVANSGPNALRETSKARKALVLIEKHGWLVSIREGAEIKGKRRREAWRIVRAAR